MPVKVLTNHKGLEYFMTTKKLTPRQVRWAKFLSEFNFKVTYQSGKKNDKADALTRKPNERPISDEDDRQEHRMQVLLPPARIEMQLIEVANEPNKESVKAKHSNHKEAEAESHEEAKRKATPAEPWTELEEEAEEAKVAKELRRFYAAKPHAEHEESVETKELDEEITKDLPSLPD